MENVTLRTATEADRSFVLRVTEACMRDYSIATWGAWEPERMTFDPALDQIIQATGEDVGVFAFERREDHFRIDKLYILPAFQNREIGAVVLRGAIAIAGDAGAPLRLTVLEVNPARRFYERHGFVLTHVVPPRQHMEWRGER